MRNERLFAMCRSEADCGVISASDLAILANWAIHLRSERVSQRNVDVFAVVEMFSCGAIILIQVFCPPVRLYVTHVPFKMGID